MDLIAVYGKLVVEGILLARRPVPEGRQQGPEGRLLTLADFEIGMDADEVGQALHGYSTMVWGAGESRSLPKQNFLTIAEIYPLASGRQSASPRRRQPKPAIESRTSLSTVLRI